jgi:bifunctional non-homologous end joining protein LigD
MIGPDVMLAARDNAGTDLTLARLSREGWWFELKFDGIRAVITRTSAGDVMIFNRRRRDITYRYPDVARDVAAMSGFVGTVDGEIVVTDEQGHPDFAAVHRRDAQQSPRAAQLAARAHPAQFIAFDILEGPDLNDVRSLPYGVRRELLGVVFAGGRVSPASQDGATLWAFVQANALEGLIAKRPDSTYKAGRHGSWVKLKSTKRISALVCGVKAGKGSRGPIGALTLCLWDPATSTLVGIGSVGSGLSEADLRWMHEHVGTGAPIVVEVEFLEVSASGQLRMPVFRGVRRDIAASECTVGSLPVRRSAAG